jgi:hypothetical protein
MARVGHALPKVSLGPAIPYPSTPCRRATPETALWSVAVFYPLGHLMPYAYDEECQRDLFCK